MSQWQLEVLLLSVPLPSPLVPLIVGACRHWYVPMLVPLVPLVPLSVRTANGIVVSTAIAVFSVAASTHQYRCCFMIASLCMTDASSLMRKVVVGLGRSLASTKWAETLCQSECVRGGGGRGSLMREVVVGVGRSLASTKWADTLQQDKQCVWGGHRLGQSARALISPPPPPPFQPGRESRRIQHAPHDAGNKPPRVEGPVALGH